MSEDENDRTLSPADWQSFVGQAELVKQLRTKCEASFALERPLGHILITGPLGSGKTTLARLAAAETGDHLEVISRAVDERGLMQALWNIPTGAGVLFIDEAHRLSKTTQESLLTLTEEGYIQSKWGTDHFPWLTVIMATTEKQKINAPLRSRCTILDMDPYSDEEMREIVVGMADRAGVSLPCQVIDAIATAAVGVPRAARLLVLGAQELVATKQKVTPETVLAHCRVEADGLTRDHLGYLQSLHFLGGQAGLENLSTHLSFDRTQTVATERLLVDRGYVRRGPSGRILTGAGRARLNGSQNLRRAS